MQCHCGCNCLAQHLWQQSQALRDMDRVNDGRADSHHQPLCAWIYWTAEVRIDKLATREWERLILNHQPCLGPYSRIDQ